MRKDKEARKEYRRNRHLTISYGMTEAKYHSMVKKRNGRCDICKRRIYLCVDHDHDTGKVRGLLCRRCNSSLGWFEEFKDDIQHYLL